MEKKTYALIINNRVDNIAFEPQEGYIEVPNNVFGGMIKREDGSYSYPQKTEDELTQIKVYDAKEYLSTTDFKMTVDYFSTLEEAKKQELLTKRAEAREYIRANEP